MSKLFANTFWFQTLNFELEKERVHFLANTFWIQALNLGGRESQKVAENMKRMVTGSDLGTGPEFWTQDKPLESTFG